MQATTTSCHRLRVLRLQVTIHAHAAMENGHISGLVATVDPKTGESSKRKPRVLLKNQSAVVEVTVHRAMCLEEYSVCRAMGRVILREGGQTLSVGIVTQIIEWMMPGMSCHASVDRYKNLKSNLQLVKLNDVTYRYRYNWGLPHRENKVLLGNRHLHWACTVWFVPGQSSWANYVGLNSCDQLAVWKLMAWAHLFSRSHWTFQLYACMHKGAS